jgi:hypothetical protein
MKLAYAIAVLMACSPGCGKKPDPDTAPVAHDERKLVASPGAAVPTTTPDATPQTPPPPSPPSPPSPSPPPLVDAAVAAVAADDNPRTSELCSEVLEKIVACRKDKEFLSALDEGVDAKRKAANKKHLVQIVKWHYTDCGALPTAIEDGGFLDNWSRVSAMPGILESCGKLGTALQAAGGLFGGDVAN